MTHVDTVSSDYRLGFKVIKRKKPHKLEQVSQKLFAPLGYLPNGVKNMSTQEPVHRCLQQLY